MLIMTGMIRHPGVCTVLGFTLLTLGGCTSTLSQNFKHTLPGGDVAGRMIFGVERADVAEVVMLDTTEVRIGDVIDVEMERFDRYLNKGLVPVGWSMSLGSGQKEPQAVLLASQYGASVVVVEIRDPPPYQGTIETQVPTLMTESIHVDGTANFDGNVSRIGWGPGTIDVWVDPYSIKCRLWAKRSWPPNLGVYFTEEMRTFRGHADAAIHSKIKSAADRWRLRNPGKPVPPRGARVDHIIPGTPAEAIGIQRRDILVSIDGRGISDEAAARSALDAAAGREVEVVVMRQSGNQAGDEAEGWAVAVPMNPLFQDADPTPYRRLSRAVSLDSTQ